MKEQTGLRCKASQKAGAGKLLDQEEQGLITFWSDEAKSKFSREVLFFYSTFPPPLDHKCSERGRSSCLF